MVKTILITCFSVVSLLLSASNLKITNCIFDGNINDPANPSIKATLTVSWDNAWHNKKNHDAVWLFFKIAAPIHGRSMLHGFIKNSGYKLIHNYITESPQPLFWVPGDNTGIMISPASNYRGNISWRIQLEFDLEKIKGIDKENNLFAFPYAIEMVKIPESPFYAGEKDEAFLRSDASFHDPVTKDYVLIDSENELKIGLDKGNIYYNNKEEIEYKGDTKGSLSKKFPKGYAEFYLMKYELNDGLYTQFLNSIGNYWSAERANHGSKVYYEKRGSIFQENGVYKTHSPNRPSTYTSWTDEMAITDWAALRPMTELEYEKACRGPEKPKVTKDFPWGSNNKEKVSRFYDENNELVNSPFLTESKLSDENLELFGASYYWVMDLNGSLWERCVSTGTEKGRAFQGSHGDGMLHGYYGTANNEDWPNTYDGKGGISYRGGGTYEKGMVGTPQSPVASRAFGAWSEGPRDVAYGYRAARSK